MFMRWQTQTVRAIDELNIHTYIIIYIRTYISSLKIWVSTKSSIADSWIVVLAIIYKSRTPYIRLYIRYQVCVQEWWYHVLHTSTCNGPARRETAGFLLCAPRPLYPRRNPGPKRPSPAAAIPRDHAKIQKSRNIKFLRRPRLHE